MEHVSLILAGIFSSHSSLLVNFCIWWQCFSGGFTDFLMKLSMETSKFRIFWKFLCRWHPKTNFIKKFVKLPSECQQSVTNIFTCIHEWGLKDTKCWRNMSIVNNYKNKWSRMLFMEPCVRAKKLLVNVAVPPAPVRVPSQRPATCPECRVSQVGR